MSAQGVTIGGPREEEATALARVHVQTWREAYGDLLSERFYDDAALEARKHRWVRLLADAETASRTCVARHRREVIGFASYGPSRVDTTSLHRRDEQLYAIYVLRDWYGHGVGQDLLEAAVGRRPAELWVARDNPRARQFYAKNGFIDTGEVKVDDDLEGLVEMRLVR